MRLFDLLLATPLAIAAPLLEVKGQAIPGKWIVVMKEDYDIGGVLGKKRDVELQSLVAPRHTYSMGNFKAYAMDASDEVIHKIASLEDHPEFEGRATWGPSFVANDAKPTVDENGHGTHVAGTAGSKTYGVAKRTNLIAVKVLNAAGSGPISQIIAGIQWVVDDAKSKNRLNRSVANLSLGALAIGNSTMSLAAGAAVEEGLFIAAAAGNSQTPVEFFCPAQYPTVCSIAATAQNDSRAYFSNYGNGIDLFAPGVGVISTYNNGSTAVLSGTSMSAPHIAGLGVYLLALEGDRDPVALCERMQELATKDIVTDSMSPNNMVAFNGVDETPREGYLDHLV